MQSLYIFLLSFVSTIALGCPEVSQSLKPYIPIVTIDLCRSDYQVNYSVKLKSPILVAEHLTDKEINVKETRVNSFKPDPQLDHGQRAELSDYLKSGFDRGHMAPAGDASSSDAMSESFYLSNMVPQTPENNRGIWKSLEEQVRAKVIIKKDLFVFTGPIFSNNPKTIGKDNIPVPYALFKIIYDEKTNEVTSFIIPNEVEDISKLNTFITSLKEIKDKTGIEFFKSITIIEKKNL